MAPTSTRALAETATREFVEVKHKLLAKVRAEQITMNDVVAKLRRKYEQQTGVFLRETGTTYGTWLSHGPKREWDEVLEATRDSSVWDRLVDTFDKREVA